MLDAVDFAECGDADGLKQALDDMREGLSKIIDALKRINGML